MRQAASSTRANGCVSDARKYPGAPERASRHAGAAPRLASSRQNVCSSAIGERGNTKEARFRMRPRAAGRERRDEARSAGGSRTRRADGQDVRSSRCIGAGAEAKPKEPWPLRRESGSVRGVDSPGPKRDSRSARLQGSSSSRNGRARRRPTPRASRRSRGRHTPTRTRFVRDDVDNHRARALAMRGEHRGQPRERPGGMEDARRVVPDCSR